MGVKFPGSPDPTIGVEIELQTVDPATMTLISGAPRLLEAFQGDPHIKKELMQCCLEVNSSVCHDMAQMERDLRARLTRVFEVADGLGIGLIAAGAHPFSSWRDQDVTQDKRYHAQLERVQWTARRLLTFGLHVHVGIASAERAIAVYNALSKFLPHLLALSASSPFWEGMDTGLDSVRSKVFESLPGGGIPFRVRNWTEFQQMVTVLQRSGTIASIQELWGDLRPHSTYGTLEVRVCDAMPDLRETLAVTALVQALVVWLSDLYDRGTFIQVPRYWVLQENKWRAARWGMNARLVIDEHGNQRHFRHAMEDLLEQLAPISEALGSWRYLQEIVTMLEHGGSAARQRHLFHETSSLEEVGRALERELRASVVAPMGEDLVHPSYQPGEHPRFRNPLHGRSRLWRDY